MLFDWAHLRDTGRLSLSFLEYWGWDVVLLCQRFIQTIVVIHELHNKVRLSWAWLTWLWFLHDWRAHSCRLSYFRWDEIDVSERSEIDLSDHGWLPVLRKARDLFTPLLLLGPTLLQSYLPTHERCVSNGPNGSNRFIYDAFVLFCIDGLQHACENLAGITKSGHWPSDITSSLHQLGLTDLAWWLVLVALFTQSLVSDGPLWGNELRTADLLVRIICVLLSFLTNRVNIRERLADF